MRARTDSQEVETIDIKAMVNDILDLTEPPATFTFEKNLQLTRLVGSRTPVETCLRNLIGNAVKHHDRDDGHVEISCVEEGGFCVFRVADDGPGIPPTVHDRIFKLFQTLNKSRDGGTGLGLAITKRLVERHGGSIAIQSNENSRGTAFVVRWPMFHRRDLERDDR